MESEKGMSRKERDMNATDRQQIQKSQDKIFDEEIETIDIETTCPNTYVEIDKLCTQYLGTPPTYSSTYDADQFKKDFKDKIIDHEPPRDKPSIKDKIWKERALTYSSNIIFRMDMFREHQKLVSAIINDITTITDDAMLNIAVRTKIKNYMDSYNDLPRFLEAAGLKLEDTNLIRN